MTEVSLEVKQNLAKYQFPIILDNQNLRKRLPTIDAHFSHLENEAVSIFSQKHLLDDRVCPVCGCLEYSLFCQKWGADYVECSSCTHVYVKNPLKEESLLQAYANSLSDKYDREVQESDFHREYWDRVYTKYIQLLVDLGLNLQNADVLDIGAGNGYFLKKLLHTKCRLSAAEYADDCHSSLLHITQNTGGALYFQQPFNASFAFDRQYDLVTMWGVLEHIYDPVLAFSQITRLLQDTGIFLALIPNVKSAAIRLLGSNTPTLNPRGHINFFTETSLKLLCDQFSLTLLHKFPELPIIDLMHPFLDNPSQAITNIISNDECYYSVYIVAKSTSSFSVYQ